MPNPRVEHPLLAALVVLVSLTSSCGDGGSSVEPVIVTTDLTHFWDRLPHRISQLEVTSTAAADGSGVTLRAQNDGGTFGAVDGANVRQAFDVWRAADLVSLEGSVVVEIGPTGSVDPEGHVATAVASETSAELAAAGAVVAFLRGYRVDSDLYEDEPAFESAIPYDPALGYTTQGIGIQLGVPTVSGDVVSFDVTARNSLGFSDRDDLNQAIVDATTWVRVDYLLVGATGSSANASRGEVSYDLSYAEYGLDTAHAHAEGPVQALSVAGAAGAPNGLTGITGFDVWLNVAGRGDPGCAVVQEEINTWDEMISGPGRYVTELSVRLWDTSYDAARGEATGRMDLMLSNTSEFKEVGNICLEVRGEMGLLQFGGAAQVETQSTGDIALTRRGAVNERELTFGPDGVTL